MMLGRTDLRLWAVALGLAVAGCSAEGTGRGPGTVTSEIVPAKAPQNGADAHQYWVEFSPDSGTMHVFPLYPGNRIFRNPDGSPAIGFNYNFAGTATEDSSCTPGTNCPVDTVHLFTDPNRVTYVEGGICYHNGIETDISIDPTCGGALDPVVNDNCLEELTFCGPIQITSSYALALPDPVLDIGSPDGIITGCTNNSTNSQGLAAQDSPAKIDPATSAYVPSVPGDGVTTFPCAYSYGNLTQAAAADRDGLGDVLTPGVNSTLQSINTDMVALRLSAGVDFAITLTLYHSTPALDTDPATSFGMYDASFNELTCVDPSTTGNLVWVQGGGFGPPAGCLTGGLPPVCNDAVFPTSGCCVTGPSATTHRLVIAGGAAGGQQPNNWSDSSIISNPLGAGVYGCKVTVQTPLGNVTTDEEIVLCPDRWRSFTTAPGLSGKGNPAGGVLGDFVVVAGGRTSSTSGTPTNTVQALALPRCSNASPNTVTTQAVLPGPRWGAATTVASNGLYVIGGSSNGNNCTSTVYRLPSIGDSWATMAALPGPTVGSTANLCQGTAVTLIDSTNGREYIVVVGGSNFPNPRTSGTQATLNAVTFVYDVASNTWARFTAADDILDTLRLNASGAAFNGSPASGNKALIVGGAIPSGLAGNTAVSAITAVDVLTISGGDPSVTQVGVSELPAARSLPGVTVRDGVFYVHGGATTTALNAAGTSNLYAIDQAAIGGGWTELTSSGTNRRVGGVLVVSAIDETDSTDLVRLLHVSGIDTTLATTAAEYNP